MSGTELLAKKTPVDVEDMFDAMVRAWHTLFGVAPARKSVLLLLAQWALETGNGRSMWCYNLGNVKATVGGAYDYCFFACNEVLSSAQAQAYAQKDPMHVKITKQLANGSAITWFYPPHAACCFRAFQTLDEGAVDYVRLLHKRFTQAWPSVVSGDCQAFCHALKQQRYYTADEGQYTAGVQACFNRFAKQLEEHLIPEMVPVGSATFDTSSELHSGVPDEESKLWSPFSAQLEDCLHG